MAKRVDGIFWNGNRYILAAGYWARFSKTVDNRTVTILLHREVMSQVLGRPLMSYEIVHHKDGNKQNNSPDNLELHTKSSHAKEHTKGREAEWFHFTCPECGSPAKKPARNVRGNHKKNREGPFCSRECAGKRNQRLRDEYSHHSHGGGRPRKSSWSDQEAKDLIVSGLTISEVSRRLGASRSAIREALKRYGVVDQLAESTDLGSV